MSVFTESCEEKDEALSTKLAYSGMTELVAAKVERSELPLR